MSRCTFIVLVDGDVRRRATISHRLSVTGIHVEPFDGLAELINAWPQSGLILAHDDQDSITLLGQHMGRAGEWLPLVAYSENPLPRQVVKAITDGAIDYLSWPFDEAELTETLDSAHARAETISSTKMRVAVAQSRIERLSGREREVLNAVASGLSNHLIAKELGISARTVECHRANMLNKIGADHISDAIRVAIEASLVN